MAVITEDVYLKFGVCVHNPKSSPYYQGRQFEMHFFFSELYPFFDIDFFSSIKHTTAEHLHPHAMLLFYPRVENIVGKEKMLFTSIFSLSNNVFKRGISSGMSEVVIVW